MAKYLEKHFNRDFRKYSKNLLNNRTFVYELKVSKKDYLSFKALPKHQEYALLACRNGVGHYKIPDDTMYGAQRPFDGFNLCGVEALVGIMFRTTEQKKDFYLIDIDDFIEAREEVDRASLTEEKAAEIGDKHTLA